MTEMAFKQENVEEFYDILDEIGSGQFAVVKRCKDKSTGAEFAAKFLKRKRGKRERKGVTAEQIANEANVLRKVRHDGIIYLHDVFETSTQFTLILELLSGGELFEFLVEQEYLTENEAIDFSKQVIEAVNYLHDCHIVHLDIKPENIVLKDRTEKKLKLIDFGLAKIIPPGEIVKAIMGTPEFVAPEVINFEPVGSAADMWAVGVLTYILLSGASPFLGEDVNETFISIQNVDFDFDEELFGSISSQAKDFISNLLVKNPSKRLTARETLSHSWLQPEPAQRLKRRSTLIKTEAHKAFTARARWKQSLKKVIALNRMAILGRKDGDLSKDILFQINIWIGIPKINGVLEVMMDYQIKTLGADTEFPNFSFYGQNPDSDNSDTSDSESEMPEAVHVQKKNKILSESKLVQDTSHVAKKLLTAENC